MNDYLLTQAKTIPSVLFPVLHAGYYLCQNRWQNDFGWLQFQSLFSKGSNCLKSQILTTDINDLLENISYYSFLFPIYLQWLLQPNVQRNICSYDIFLFFKELWPKTNCQFFGVRWKVRNWVFKKMRVTPLFCLFPLVFFFLIVFKENLITGPRFTNTSY